MLHVQFNDKQSHVSVRQMKWCGPNVLTSEITRKCFFAFLCLVGRASVCQVKRDVENMTCYIVRARAAIVDLWRSRTSGPKVCSIRVAGEDGFMIVDVPCPARLSPYKPCLYSDRYLCIVVAHPPRCPLLVDMSNTSNQVYLKTILSLIFPSVTSRITSPSIIPYT